MCRVTQEIDPINISTTYVKDCNNGIPLRFFGKGFEYKILGLIPTDRHLIVAPLQLTSTRVRPWRRAIWCA